MLQNDNLITNELQIDTVSHAHLAETAKWAKFIAIAGFIFSGFILIGAYSYFENSNSYKFSGDDKMMMAVGVTFYVVVAIVWITTSIFQLRFASKLQVALQSNYQEELQSCFQNFKIYYRISGIVTIISLLLTFLGLLGLIAKMNGAG